MDDITLFKVSKVTSSKVAGSDSPSANDMDQDGSAADFTTGDTNTA